MTIRQISEQIRQRKISCVELMQETISAIESRERFGSFITYLPDEALEEVRALDMELLRGINRGPLHGIPIAHKDLFYTRDVRTTAGSLIFKDFVPAFDGDVVAHLKAAGAVSLGKTNLHELAYGITSNNPHYGHVLNPNHLERIPGGSSGGSAALVAAGLIPVATGTDTGGSIRIPAAYCGIVGIKPTYDLLSRRGILPLNYGLDHAGPLGSCVEDCALALNAMSGGHSEFNLGALPNLKGLRVGVPNSFFFDGLQADVEKAVRSRLESMRQLGAAIDEITLPNFHDVNAASRVIQMAEAAALYVNYQDASLFGQDVWANIQDGRQIFAHEYVNSQRLRAIYRREMDRLWQAVDVIITPTTAITAPLRDTTTLEINGQIEDVRLASTKFVRGWNFLGEPALSLPCGRDSLGLPIGMQLIAAPFSDAKLLQIAKTFERALN
jgi:aspartyl-tRNA(Asn)/glutamyl-tRNA(Gln) amidotransferase subunit A